jgi:hypothetical protein
MIWATIQTRLVRGLEPRIITQMFSSCRATPSYGPSRLRRNARVAIAS